MSKIFLCVPYVKKDELKEFGIRWDNDAKKWFSTQENLNNNPILKQYIYLQKPLYYKISYERKNEALSSGGKWDAEKKLWYFHFRPESLEEFLENKEADEASGEKITRIKNPHFHTFSRKMR